jgi:hypothetical protein
MGSEGVLHSESIPPTCPIGVFTTCLYMQKPLAHYSTTKLREGADRQQFCYARGKALCRTTSGDYGALNVTRRSSIFPETPLAVT